MANETSASDLVAEVRKLRRLQLENDALIDQLRRQNQHLKQMLAEHNLTVQKCLRKLEKTSQMERTEVQGEEWSSEAA